MDNDRSTETPPDAVPKTPREVEFGSPFVRLGFFAVFVLTLPFMWGETGSCNGSGKTFTGIEQITKHSDQAIAMGIIFITPILLGFVQHFLRSHLIRFVIEMVSAGCSGLGTAYCFLAAVFANLFSGKGGQLFPAPLLATIATFLMTLHALKSALWNFVELVTSRRKASPPS